MAKRPDKMPRRGILASASGLLVANVFAGAATDAVSAPNSTGATADANITPEVAAVPGITPEWPSSNPALSRAFAPIFDERDDVNLTIEGEIPAGLRGVFMRNGPNPQYLPDAHYAYPFDGTGMIHAIYLENGKARYRNRWVRTAEFVKERTAGHRIYNSTFSPPPHANLANTNIIRHAGRYLALYEGGKPYEIDRDLGTAGLFDYDGKLPTVMSAHPKLDPTTGELLSIAYNAQTGAMIYLRANSAGQLDTLIPFQAPWPTMVHDISITERHVIAFIGPAVWGGGRHGPPITWEPERGMMIAVIPRNSRSAAEIQWIRGAPFFQFHVMNAFADGDRLEVALPWYDSFSLTKPASRLELHRIVIDTKSGSVSDHPLDDRACEFPRINDRYLGRRAHYGYVGLRDARPGETLQIGAFEAIARYDLRSGIKIVHQFPAGVTVCEPLFVPDPDGKDEQDGFIFTFAHEQGATTGHFMILDARNLDAGPLAKVEIPRRVPAGLHGSWIPV
ncbi:MAG: carotenoid oxygenase family protein [Acetobacteraceae bacterium]